MSKLTRTGKAQCILDHGKVLYQTERNDQYRVSASLQAPKYFTVSTGKKSMWERKQIWECTHREVRIA
jgi:hypothetical protein